MSSWLSVVSGIELDAAHVVSGIELDAAHAVSASCRDVDWSPAARYLSRLLSRNTDGGSICRHVSQQFGLSHVRARNNAHKRLGRLSPCAFLCSVTLSQAPLAS